MRTNYSIVSSLVTTPAVTQVVAVSVLQVGSVPMCLVVSCSVINTLLLSYSVFLLLNLINFLLWWISNLYSSSEIFLKCLIFLC